MVREYKTELLPSKPSESVHTGQMGTGLLEGSQGMNVSPPHQYRPGQKTLATPNYLVDLYIYMTEGCPLPRNLHCHKFSLWGCCPKGKSEGAKQMGQL